MNNITSQFCFEGEIQEVAPLGEGLINDTYLVKTTSDHPNYILQRKNKNIFKNVPAMMENIHKVTTHLKKKLSQQPDGDPTRHTITLIPTKNQQLYHIDPQGEYWAACLCIENTHTYHTANTPQLAYQGGYGIGKFQAMLADMNDTLTDILPGFHNMKFRFQQWDETISKDPLKRKSSLSKEIQWIENRRDEMISLWDKYESGQIPTRITHNDTKISNMLFTPEGKVLCVIDLDTVLSSMCLNDYGDAIRSYANAGLEDDPNLNNVYLHMEIFENYTKGYLDGAREFLTPIEIENLAFSAKYITFEQTLRFLMDYIDGDNYFKIKYPEHNLVRTHAQYKLLQSIDENYNQMRQIIKKYSEK